MFKYLIEYIMKNIVLHSLLVDKGIITEKEIDDKMNELSKKFVDELQKSQDI